MTTLTASPEDISQHLIRATLLSNSITAATYLSTTYYGQIFWREVSDELIPEYAYLGGLVVDVLGGIDDW